MEHTLRCNSLKCRRELADRALVTTCSHIFCPDCATRLRLAHPNHDNQIQCPACGSPLTNPDDAVIANLNPTEDYKTSVLSGLSPNVIMECASRALSFWVYQTTQEVIYQGQMGKALTDKYSTLSVHLDKVINDANAEIANMHNKLSSMSTEYENMRKKNEELAQAFKEKNRKLLQTQELYDKLKRKAMLGQLQDAAENAVDSTIHEASLDTSGLGEGSQNHINNHEQRTSSYGQHRPSIYDQQHLNISYGPPGAMQGQDNSWPKATGVQCDPSGIGLSTVPGLVMGATRSPRGNMSTRIPLSNVSSNQVRSPARFPQVGLSSGLKIGQGGAEHGFPGSSRPRAQRPVPLESAMNRRPLGIQPNIAFGTMRNGVSGM
ncbi:hypothetical protein F4778DRAFT_255454 [Xylariomycetidae sp. FL2044]|nr:hypothetical protein F4778DRAFT_255454 [Xylariomycetidae sp. FL2044]